MPRAAADSTSGPSTPPITDASVARISSTPSRCPANVVTEWVSAPAPASPTTNPPVRSTGSDAPNPIASAAPAMRSAHRRTAPAAPSRRTTRGTIVPATSRPTAIALFGSADAHTGAPSSDSTYGVRYPTA